MLLVPGTGAMLLTLDSVAVVLGALLCLVTVLFCALLLEVAVIEQDSGYWATGAVVIVLRNPPRKRIIAWPTSDRRAVFRGENPVALGDPATVLRPPARAAIDGHRRWLSRQSG